MAGGPLREAKNCSKMIIDQLGPNDNVSIITYDHNVSVLVPPTPTKDKDIFYRALKTIKSGGSTNLFGGWEKAMTLLQQTVSPNSVTRVLLLSDGQANAGIVDPDEIYTACSVAAQKGISTSTYGLGHHFNEDLMIGMARSGQGNGYYGETAKDLVDPFTEEFDLLSSLCAKNTRLQVKSAEDVRIKLLNQFPQQEGGAYCLPNLAYESESWALLQISIPSTKSGNGDGKTMIDLGVISVEYQDMDGNTITLDDVSIQLPGLPSVAWKTLVPNDLVSKRIAEIEAARIQDQAKNAARRGDWGKVQRLLKKAKENAQDNEWLEKTVTTLESLAALRDSRRFSKESSYSSAKMSSRLSALNEQSNDDESIPSFLRRKWRQGKSRDNPDS